ncbi:hypothetical protein [Vreelandella massiliensis]|uniref:hypothetical protein n=1 Tax=Vreelandella massiliensis TaxID=1816686 RepID=UPI00096AC000|nr:hypothetical protein [Halomonas massiliensis]
MKLTRGFFASPLFNNTLFTSTLLAASLLSFAATAQADHHGGNAGKYSNKSEQLQERMQERRQAVYEQAGISEEKQAEINAARDEHFNAMRELREDHYARMQEILTEEEQTAIKEAMRDMHETYRGKQGHRGYHGDNRAPEAAE